MAVDLKELTCFNHQYLELTTGWYTRGGNFMVLNWPCEPSPEKMVSNIPVLASVCLTRSVYHTKNSVSKNIFAKFMSRW